MKFREVKTVRLPDKIVVLKDVEFLLNMAFPFYMLRFIFYFSKIRRIISTAD